MKTKILAILMILLLDGFALKAGNDELSFKQTVATQIKYPEFAKAQKIDVDVYISFTVNEKGEIIINQTNSVNPDFMDYVKTELKKISVNIDNEVIGKTFYYKFSFKYEE